MQNKNITFQIRCTPARAIAILDRMAGAGEISLEYADKRIAAIDTVEYYRRKAAMRERTRRMDSYFENLKIKSNKSGGLRRKS